MKKRSAVLLALSLVATLAVGARAADTLDEVKKKGVLTVGVKFRVPPFGFVDQATGELTGYDVDVAKAIAAKLGVKLQLEAVDQRTRIPELLDGKIDLIAANLTKNPDTAKVIDFSDVYVITGQGFLAKKGTVKTLGDLSGKKVGVMAGTQSELGVQTSLPSATAVPFTDLKKALQALQSGEVDAASGDGSILPAVIRMLPAGQFEIPPVQIAEIPYCLGARKGNPKFLNAVNLALKEMEKSGTAQRLVDKWFKPAPQEEASAPPDDGSAAEAAGAIVRRAATPPGMVVVILKGFFPKGADVSVYTMNGDFFCKGKVTAVFSEQIYIDVDPTRFEGVKPGFAVGMNVNKAAVKDAIKKHQNVLKSVADESKKEEMANASRREKEGLDKDQRNIAFDQKRAESRLRVEEERATNDDYYNDSYNVDVHRSW